MSDSTRVYEDRELTIDCFGPLGSFANNAYVIRAIGSEAALLIDFPDGIDSVLDTLGEQTVQSVQAVLLTHSHMDHTRGHAALRRRVNAPIFAGWDETNLDPAWEVRKLAHGESIRLGTAIVRVLATPGHTPGSVCFLAGRALLTGDALFPGGPGHSTSHDALQQEIASITGRLYPLAGETLVLPGHGPGTTIGASRTEYAVYAAKAHPSDLHGDVNWLTS